MHSSRKPRRWSGLRHTAAILAAAAISAGALTWGAGPAQAVASPTLITGSSANDSANFKNATARCPGDQRVYGAAFNVVNGNGKVAVNTLQPSADLRSVFVEANELDAGQTTAWRLDAQAICGPATAGMRLVTVSKPNQTVAEENVRVGCAFNERIYGAGYTFPFGHGEVLLNLMEYLSNRSLIVSASIDDTPLVWGITGYAICGPAPTTHAVLTTSGQVHDSNTPKSENTPSCPSGTRVHGVGVRLIGGTGDVVVDDLTTTAALVSGEGKAYENDSTSANWSVRPQVICSS
jgi:hypothetical protein